jgi:dCMP deaminase
MKPKFIDYYMKFAELTATLSYARRLKVGAVIVNGDQTIGTGYNGMPSGWENDCEYKEYKEPHWTGIDPVSLKPFDEIYPLEDEQGRYRWVTKPEVLHAESNALMKVSKSTESTNGATLFCTHAPCIDCAKLIYQAGIKTVYYKETYRSKDGLNFLRKSGINVHQYTDGS